MPIPDYQTVMLPLLQLVSVRNYQVRELVPVLSDQFDLTSPEREKLIPSGRGVTVFMSRVGWAKTYLKQAGLVRQPSRGVVEITDLGRKLLAERPDRIDNGVLERFDTFRQFQQRSRPASSSSDIEASAPDAIDTASAVIEKKTVSPAERLDSAHAELTASLQSELLEKVVATSPEFFETLVLDLLTALGYGGSRPAAAVRLGRSGDGGVDGVIHEDQLGLDRIYVQAKRYQPASRIGIDTIRSFAGALDDNGADKGVLITTSGFSTESLSYAHRNQRKRLVLIDGNELARLMIQFNVGVRVQNSFEIKRIDQDYFDELVDE